MHEIIVFVGLMVFPTWIIMDLWLTVAPVELKHNIIIPLFLLAIPISYLATRLDKCSVSIVTTKSAGEAVNIYEKRRLAIIQVRLEFCLLPKRTVS